MRKLPVVFIITALVLALVMVLALAGCGDNTDQSGQLKLTVYVGFQEDYAIKAINEFSRATGIQAGFVRMSGGEILARIRAEKSNPGASVWHGGPADTFIQAKTEGLLEPYISTNTRMIDDRYKDPDGYWTGIYVGSIGFASNKRFLQSAAVQAPESWEALLKPEFRGQVVMADPGSSGTAYTILSTIIQLMGEEQGFAYLQKLHQQVKQYPKTGSAPGRMVGLGEAGVGILFSHDTVKYQKEGFKDLVLTFPREGTGYEIGAVAMLKNAPDQQAARAFIDWAVTREAQEIGQTVGSYQNLTNPRAANPPEAIPLDKLNVIDYDLESAGMNRQRILEKWDNVIRN